MRVHAAAAKRYLLLLEPLEQRLVFSLPPQYTVPLDASDSIGDQIVTVQAYQNSARTAYGIFDTGASAITFSAGDQARFTAAGLPIPIKVPDGAVAAGVGGQVVGDVSEPATILADGLHAATLGTDSHGLPTFTANFGPNSASAGGVQAFVGTESGSPDLPTITGTPILQGRAALINMQGAVFNFSQNSPGLVVDLPDLNFVSPGYQLQAGPGTSDPVKIPLSLVGPNSGTLAGRNVTEAPNPVQDAVSIASNGITISGLHFLFDTGAQTSVISSAVAQELGLNLGNPTSGTTVQGVGSASPLPGFTLDSLTLPRTDGGTLTFTGAPVFVADVGNGLDGILGMNLFNTVKQMLYDPSGPTLSLLFASLVVHGTAVTPDEASELSQLGVPFAGDFTSTSLPVFSVASGQISGQIFLDYNDDGSPDVGEPGMVGQTLYLDINGNGVLDRGEPTTVTDAAGNYVFSALFPGTYTVREAVPPGSVVLNPLSAGYTVTVTAGTNTGGWNFASATTVPDEPTAYVTGLYGTLLDRPPEAGGLKIWLNALQQGTPRTTVAQAIWDSPEHRGLEVDRYYALYLHRAPDPAGRATFINAFASGASELDVQQAILRSPEYQAAHPTDASFINGLYVDILGRTADAGGMAYWEQILQTKQTGGRNQVILGVLTSDEAYLQVLNYYYEDLLHRPMDNTGRHAWLSVLDSGQGTLESVGIGFLVSEEYQNRQRLHIG
jgi:hypothetical protein